MRSSNTDPIIIGIFLFYYFLSLLIVIVLYRLIILQINDSIRGSTQDAGLDNIDKIKKKIQYIFLGILLVELNSIITYILILFDGNYYYIAGSKSYILFLGIILIIRNTATFLKLLVHAVNIHLSSLLPNVFVVLGLLIIHDLINHNLRFLLLAISSIILGIRFYFRIHKLITLATNPILKLRLSLSNFLIVIYAIFFVNYFIFFFSPNDYHQFNTHIEFYMFIVGVLGILLSISFYIIFSIPKSVQQFASISDREFYLNRDPRFDYNWSPIDRSFFLKTNNEDIVEDPVPADSSFTIFYNFEDSNFVDIMDILINYNGFFNTNIILDDHAFEEEYVTSELLEQKNIVYISITSNSNLEFLLDYLHKFQGYKIQFNNNFTINKIEYKENNSEFALLMVITSPWNKNRKLWIFLAQYQTQFVLSQFFKDFSHYIVKITQEKSLIALLKFFNKEGDIIPIPSSSGNLDIPDQNSIIFL